MCCTIGQTEAKLSGTRIYVGEALKNDKLVHVLAYQNHASSKPEFPNAMILPFPTSQKMSEDNVIDTTQFKDFLNNITNATRHRRRAFGKGIGDISKGVELDRAEVFEVGSYTVILADHVKQVPEALTRVPENKRPVMSERFLQGFGELYPVQPVALCCWAGGEVEAEPLLWWYEPTNPDHLFIPTMDAHDGEAPNLRTLVDTDHIISVGSTTHPNGATVMYSNGFTSHARSLLPTQVHGYRAPSPTKNGDTFVSVADMRNLSKDGVMIKRGANLTQIDTQYHMQGWH